MESNDDNHMNAKSSAMCEVLTSPASLPEKALANSSSTLECQTSKEEFEDHDNSVSNQHFIKEESLGNDFVQPMLQAVNSAQSSVTTSTNSEKEHSLPVNSSNDEDCSYTSESDSSSSTTTSDSSSEESASEEDGKVNSKAVEHPVAAKQEESPRNVPYKDILLESDPVVKDLSVILPENAKLEMIGNISSLIENSVVVIKGIPNKPALNLDSVLFFQDKSPLGQIYETFGPVSSPYYVVCLKDGKIKEELKIDEPIFCAPEIEDFSKYVLTAQLTGMKGSDASWLNDKEPPQEMLDYSGDEEERNAKKLRKLAKKPCSSDQGEQSIQRQPRRKANWSNKSIRFTNPQPDASFAGWAEAVSRMNSRRTGSVTSSSGCIPPSPVFPPQNFLAQQPRPCSYNPMFPGPRSYFPNMPIGPPHLHPPIQPPTCWEQQRPPAPFVQAHCNFTPDMSVLFNPLPPPPPPPPPST